MLAQKSIPTAQFLGSNPDFNYNDSCTNLLSALPTYMPTLLTTELEDMGRVPGANIKQFLDQHSSVEIKQSDWLQTVIGTWNSQSECFISAQQGYSKNYDTGSLYSNYRRKLIIQSSCRGNGYQLSKLHYDLLQKLCVPTYF